MYYRLYQILSILLQPAFVLVAYFRLLRGWESYQRIAERYGYATVQKPDEQLKTIWVHCASVGESMSSLSLVNKITQNDPNVFVVITTMTKTAADILEKRLSNNERAIHQYVPYDSFFWVRRFIENWQPEKLLLFESEFWPNLLSVAYEKHIPIYLVNARLSDKSVARWQRYGEMIFPVSFDHLFKKAFAQTDKDKLKLESLGIKRVYSYGNLKYCAPPLPYDDKEVHRLLGLFCTSNIWLASSTHQGEDEILLRAHKILKDEFPDAVLIIAPRHVERATSIRKIALNDFYFNVCLRSCEESKIDKDRAIDVYIADTMGELGTFYKLSPISFVAGSLREDIGGHNIIEPAQLKSAVLHGPYMHNFSEVAAIFKDNDAAIEVAATEKEIAGVLIDLLKNQRKRRNLAIKGHKLVGDMQETLDKVYWSIIEDQEL